MIKCLHPNCNYRYDGKILTVLLNGYSFANRRRGRRTGGGGSKH